MSVKSDRWILRMCREHQLITPYEETLIRDIDGRRIISAGLSSYGYDLRLASDGFRVFSPIASAEIDPKNFDESSLVESPLKTATDGSKYWLMPPHTYALGVTVETFNIPRNVIGICLGKSTYARCFRGDTRVALVDGTTPTLEELAVRAEKGEMFWGYSLGDYGRIIVTLLARPRYVGRDQLLKLRLDNNEEIYCTPDHEFLRRDGQLASACNLRAGDSLMPLYRNLYRGYEAVYQPLNGHLTPTHRLADEWNVRNGIYVDRAGTHRHHLDGDRLNNLPPNLVRMEVSEHMRYHNARNYQGEFDPAEHGAAIRAALERLYEDDEWYRKFTQSQRHKALQFWHDERYAEARQRLLEIHQARWTEEERQRQRERQERFWDLHPESRVIVSERSKNYWGTASEQRHQQQREIARQLNMRTEITAEKIRRALDATGSIRGAARLLNCDRTVFCRFPQVIQQFKGTSSGPPRANHKIQAITEVKGEHDVYCLTVPEAGNFALAAGVFVKNCGIIVNTTPLEPGWQGRLVLEFSNSADLPVRIYANEGVAQVTFFESDEDCETSYADRKGKYQNQESIVTARL